MRDLIRLAYNAVAGHKLRSALSMLGIAIGIASVILLTSIGEGTRRYIVGQFSQFGTNILSVTPGKSETLGIPGVLGGTTRKLTIDDALALERLSGVDEVVTGAYGTARVEANGRGRSVFIYGVTPNVPTAWKFAVRQGSFWPAGDPRRGGQVAVLGPKLKRELFGEENALGRFVRIGGSRFRVLGIMESKGQFIGFDIDDAAYIPVASSMRIFNLPELNEIHVVYEHAGLADPVEREVRRVLIARHNGKEDFTITTQEAMLDVFGNIMNMITLAVGAIAGISLLVGSIGILTMMWIAVGERTQEIGLVRAIGATRRRGSPGRRRVRRPGRNGDCRPAPAGDSGAAGPHAAAVRGSGGGDEHGDGAALGGAARAAGGRARPDRGSADGVGSIPPPTSSPRTSTA
jgi:putative ABC transport system permease protein